ncbi:MAG TPA: hypothetical protein VEQ61_03740 [Thermoleophilaceae bacterium]|nr:hypothetical protein [Thermoleophilaceae bacterium]
MAEPHRKLGATPAFDELFDCARRLGTGEVVIEHTPGSAGPRLAVVVLRCEDGAIAHRAPVSSSIDEAAARICAGLRESRRR